MLEEGLSHLCILLQESSDLVAVPFHRALQALIGFFHFLELFLLLVVFFREFELLRRELNFCHLFNFNALI